MNTEKPFNLDDFRAPPPSRLTKLRWWLRRFHKRFNEPAVDQLFRATQVPFVEEDIPEIHEGIWTALHRVDPQIHHVWATFASTLIVRVMALEAEVTSLKGEKNPNGFLQ